MSKTYRTLMVTEEVLKALQKFRQDCAETILHQKNQFGLGHAISVLLWNWDQRPASYDDLKAQVQAAPRRGRPRTKIRPPPLP